MTVMVQTFEDARLNKTVRALGGIERFMHLYSKTHPIAFCVACRISGYATPSRYRAAFDTLQARHPILSISIRDDAKLGAVVERTRHPLKVSIIPCTSEPLWHPVVERELALPFPADQGPLMRATILEGETGATIILTFNYVLADGMSGVYIIQDLLTVLAGEALPKQPVLNSLDKLVEKAFKASRESAVTDHNDGQSAEALRAFAMPDQWRPFGEAPRVTSATFNHTETQRIAQACKANGCAVHGAICAAVAQTVSPEVGGRAVRIFQPINVRPLLGPSVRKCGLYVGMTAVDYDAGERSEFWGLAHHTSRELAPARTSDGVLTLIDMVSAHLPIDADEEIARGFYGSMMPIDATVSNLGLVPSTPKGAPLQLEAVWGPMAQAFAKDERFVGAATLNGCLRLVQTSPGHVGNILDDVRRRLLDACGP